MCCAASCAAPCATRICSARKDPLMYRLVPALVAEMGEAYPELKRAEALIAETLKLEEERFRETLARGLKLLDEATGDARQGRHACRRSRVQALRHLRLPARSDRGRAARARHRPSTPHGFDAAMAAAARGSAQGLGRLGRGGDRHALVRHARRIGRRPNSSATTPRRPKATSSPW